jgi:hypothetical protein
MKKGIRDPRPYIGLHKEVLFGPAWAALSPVAKDLYCLLKGKRNPRKGEEVRLSYREVLKLKHRGLRKLATISKAFKELEAGGWIRAAREEGGLYGLPKAYVLTGKFDAYGIR